MTATTALLDAEGRLVHETSNAPVAWWSFTKTLIAASAAKLSSEGRIDLDAPMNDPRYTLRQTLAHTAGLPDYGDLPAYHSAVAAAEPAWSDAAILSRTRADRLIHAPDSDWRYSNIGYLLARRRLESLTGRTLGQLLRETFFDPLGLTRSRLAETAQDMAALAHPPPYAYDPGWVYHGTAIGPASDAARCLHAILDGPLLTDVARAELQALRPIGGAIPGRPWRMTGYGLGLMIGEMQGPEDGECLRAIGHSAGGPGSAGAVFRFDRGDRKATVAVFGAYDDAAPAEFGALRLASQ